VHRTEIVVKGWTCFRNLFSDGHIRISDVEPSGSATRKNNHL
jgi:hypothetical protein